MPEAAPVPTPPSKAGKAMVCYNHYKSEFNIDDSGAMAWSDIDEEYCISFVFQGEFSVALTSPAGELIQRDGSGNFQGLEDGCRYTLGVQEDAKTAAASAAAAREVAARNGARREPEEKEDSLSKSRARTAQA